jgi:hypothetical protein
MDKAFGLKRLVEIITHGTSSHEKGVHYQIFDVSDVADINYVKKRRRCRRDTH